MSRFGWFLAAFLPVVVAVVAWNAFEGNWALAVITAGNGGPVAVMLACEISDAREARR